MAHYTQLQFAKWTSEFFPEFFKGQRVLEVGSLDINGSVRQFFKDCHYVGLDVGEGPGVDVVCGGQEYDAPTASFDVVCSFESMEHNPYWKETFANMVRLVRPGGLVLMSCATKGRPEHGTRRSTPHDSPLTADVGWDHYQNLAAGDFRREFDIETLFQPHLFSHYYYSADLLFFGFRAGQPAPERAGSVARTLRRRYLLRNWLNYLALKRMLSVFAGLEH